RRGVFSAEITELGHGFNVVNYIKSQITRSRYVCSAGCVQRVPALQHWALPILFAMFREETQEDSI
ncbi:hypothetical protein J6590_027337, partial [Homalodisca vitripennis]